VANLTLIIVLIEKAWISCFMEC